MIEAVLTSKTLMGLISDKKSFKNITDDYFQILDLDRDGILSPSELRQGLNRVVAVESEVASREETDDVYKAIFERFGEKLPPEKFRDLMAEILMAMARAFGNTPVIMVVHNDGLIMKAVHHQATRARLSRVGKGCDGPGSAPCFPCSIFKKGSTFTKRKKFVIKEGPKQNSI